MDAEPAMSADAGKGDLPDWRANYFNYFTEIEEHFQRARGTAMFLLSPLDWALIEGWKNGGVPLEAVLRGIDEAFDKWRSRKRKTQAVNSLAYCAQAVLSQAQKIAAGTPAASAKEYTPPFPLEEVRAWLDGGARMLGELDHPGYREIADTLYRMAADAETHFADLERLEQRLTALEEKMTAIAKTLQTDEQLFTARRDLDAQLRPYRGKMSAEQLSMLERNFLDRRLLEDTGLRRLSLFYLGSL